MATTASILLRAIVNDGTRDVVNFAVTPTDIADVVQSSGKLEEITLAAATFQALTVPTGAVLLVGRVVSGATTVTLKGNTADVGVVLQSGTLTAMPFCLPLGTTPTPGLLASGTTVVELLWL
jgi:ABC-type transporter Mla maintaining outer membrane lipid asymmetry ATPase subunit MlaF